MPSNVWRGRIGTLPKYSMKGAYGSGVTTFTVNSSTIVTSKFLPSILNKSEVTLLIFGW
ncbi:MAG: hypothetical protein JW388_0401 [Nitrospira sp.]|nr:hypothetical protein [Nitrospira sp.]